MPRGRPKKLREPTEAVKIQRPARVWKSPMDIVRLMEDYRAVSNGRVRGLFEDCKADIYRLWLLDYNDWRLKEVKATGTSDRVYHEWRAKFVRAFGEIVRIRFDDDTRVAIGNASGFDDEGEHIVVYLRDGSVAAKYDRKTVLGVSMLPSSVDPMTAPLSEFFTREEAQRNAEMDAA